MPPRDNGWQHLPSSRELLVVVVIATALLSAVAGARVLIPELEDWRAGFGDEALRDNAAARALGFDPAAWEFLDGEVRSSDRYAIVTANPSPFEVRNFAAYWLLPAVRVVDPRRADVVVYVDDVAPRDAYCFEGRQHVCVVRREPR